MTHPEHDLLTGFVDGELSERELSTVETHLEGCVTCATVLEDVKQTRALLRTLPQPEISELHRKQLWREINRARRAPANLWRALVAVGGTAAAIVAFVGITMLGTNKDSSVLASEVTIENTASNYSAADLELWVIDRDTAPLALEASGVSKDDATATPTPSNPTVSAAPASPLPSGVAAPEANNGALIARCESEFKPGGDDGAKALRYVIGSFEGTPAFLLAYETPRDKPTRIEIYAIAVDDCRVLYRATR